MELAASTVCNVLSGPGDLLRALISGAVESPVLALSFLLLLGVFLGFLVFITSFEILELVPILSFVLDWIEFLLMGPGGPVVVLLGVVSLGISYGLIPC